MHICATVSERTVQLEVELINLKRNQTKTKL